MKTVCIDPAHGAAHPGVVGPGGTTEAELNLRVALCVKDLLDGFDCKVELTRDGPDGPPNSIRHIMAKRADVALQIHHGGVSQREPIEVWVSPRNNRKPLKLARLLSKEMAASCRTTSRVVDDVINGKFAIFDVAPHALMVYPGHLHTPLGEEMCKREDWSRNAATGIFRALMEWMQL